MNRNDQDDPSAAAKAAEAALLAALAAQRQDRTPPRDLWAGIEARLRAPTQPPGLADAPRPAALAEHRLDRTPPRDLWPGIEARIHGQRWRRLRTPLAAAAGLVATLVVMLGLQVYRGSGKPAPLAAAPRPASAEVLAATRDIAPANPALRPLSTRPLAPEARALVRANLKIVSSAESQLRRAIAADPDAAYLESLLASTRQQKQELRLALAER